MIAIEFRALEPGTCAWCRKNKNDVFTVSFSDKSFMGPLCRVDLLRAIGMKLSAGRTVTTRTEATTEGRP